MTFLPYDSDGALFIYDGTHYGHETEVRNPKVAYPHHPLMGLIGYTVAPTLAAWGVSHPGHLIYRVLSGLAAAWVILQVSALAGRRVVVGAAVAAFLAVTWGFILAASTGETILPGAALALWALTLATRADPPLVRSGVALTLALLCRQDNILLVPAFAAALAAALPAGARLRGVTRVIGASGLVTLGLYYALWCAVRQEWLIYLGPAGEGELVKFWKWLTWLGWIMPWEGGRSFAVYLTSLGSAITGAQWPRGETCPWVGPLYVAVLIVAGVLLRGSDPRRGLALPVAIALAVRAPFHTWFEAANHEWLVLPLIFIGAGVAAGARGAPATGPRARTAGGVLLGALIVWTLASHAHETWRLRERNLTESIIESTSFDRAGWSVLTVGPKVELAMQLRGLDFTKVDVNHGEAGAIKDIVERVGADPRPTLVLFDRYAQYCSPYDVRHRRESRMEADALIAKPAPGVTARVRDGMVQAVTIIPESPATRPEGR